MAESQKGRGCLLGWTGSYGFHVILGLVKLGYNRLDSTQVWLEEMDKAI